MNKVELRKSFIKKLLDQLAREVPFEDMECDFPFLFEHELAHIIQLDVATIGKIRRAETDNFIAWSKLGRRVVYKAKDVVNYYYLNVKLTEV